MNLDLASFAFGCTLIEGTGTPPWGTALGQQKPDYEFKHEGCQELIVGMVYNSVPRQQVCLPLGKGGNIVSGVEAPNILLTSVFHKVYVNDVRINYPFTMIIYRESSNSHCGRKHLKYSPKISYRSKDGYVYTNEDFIEIVRKTFSLSKDACWFIYKLDLSHQTELRMYAIFVDKQHNVIYQDSHERKQAWQELVEQTNH